MDINQEELAKFDKIAHQWWDKQGPFKPLHETNALRLQFIATHAPLLNKRVLDIGCGGGLLTEALQAMGAEVTGIDASMLTIEIAKAHDTHNTITYACNTAQAFARLHPHAFDIVTCMELLEHVPSPAALVTACTLLVKKEGDLFFSTLNRNWKSYLFGIIGAEYILKLVPRGTHDYQKFVKPYELSQALEAEDFALKHVLGFGYNPFTKSYYTTPSIAVNYAVHAKHKALL